MINQEFKAQGTKYQVLSNFRICCMELGGLKVVSFCAVSALSMVCSSSIRISCFIFSLNRGESCTPFPHLGHMLVNFVILFLFHLSFGCWRDLHVHTPCGIIIVFSCFCRKCLVILNHGANNILITDLSNDSLTQLLLYGDQDLSTELNRNILELTLRFIHDTGRFD